MKKLVSSMLALPAFSVIACAVPVDGDDESLREVSQEIKGGVHAPQYREGVLIQKDGAAHCSGALISPDMVLTAGHCLDGLDASQITLELPHHGGIERDAAELINIWAYPSPLEFEDNEVALIRLNADVDLSPYPYPIVSGVALGDDVRSLGRKKDGVLHDGEMFISADDSVFAHNGNFYGTNPNLLEGGDSGGPVFTTDVVPGTTPNVIVAVNSGNNRVTNNSYLSRTDSQLDLIESYVEPPSCSEHSSDVVRLQMHQLKMIKNAEFGAADLRYRVTFGGSQSGWSSVTRGVYNGLTLPDGNVASSLTQHARTHEGPRSLCIPGRIEVQERNLNIFGQWSTSRSVQQSMTYCYDDSDDRWELQGTNQTQGSANLKDGKFEIDLEWKAVRTKACSKTVDEQLVRLKHVNSGKCAYSAQPVNGGGVHNWTCWNDPNMMYVLDPTPQHGANAVRVRHLQTNSCWYAGNNNGDKIKHWSCWDDPNMVYFVDDIGNGQVRLRHRDSGKCAYGSGSNGGALKSWSCWNDPNMRFEVLPQ